MAFDMLLLLDKTFFVFHALLTLFNVVGWAWRPTRRLHLIAFGLTGASWFVLGAIYGWGYCVCTDWHFQVREKLGYSNPETYIQLLASELLGVSMSRAVSDWIAVSTFVLIAVATTIVWAQDWRRRRLRRLPA